MSGLRRWWFDDLPPLSGPLRYAFYLGLFVFALRDGKSPLRGVIRYAAIDPIWYETHGLMSSLGVGRLPVAVLWVLTAALAIAWTAAAFGLKTRVAIVTGAIVSFLLHGLLLDTNAYNRGWFVPIYAQLALCFARTTDEVSADARWFGDRPTPDGRVADSGFARKVVLVVLVGFYFASGVTKLVQAGWAWADGQTLLFEFGQSGEPARALDRGAARDLPGGVVGSAAPRARGAARASVMAAAPRLRPRLVRHAPGDRCDAGRAVLRQRHLHSLGGRLA